jgi:hypothetical protein
MMSALLRCSQFLLRPFRRSVTGSGCPGSPFSHWAPDHAGESLTLDHPGVIVRDSGLYNVIKGIGFAQSGLEYLLEIAKSKRVRCTGQTQANFDFGLCRDGKLEMAASFAAFLIRINGIGLIVDDGVMKGVLEMTLCFRTIKFFAIGVVITE